MRHEKIHNVDVKLELLNAICIFMCNLFYLSIINQPSELFYSHKKYVFTTICPFVGIILCLEC